MAVMISTIPDEVNLDRIRRSRVLRRLFFVALSVFLLLGLLNVYGVRTEQVSSSAGGYELTVHYASVSRPGLATPWSVRVRRLGGFGGPVTLASTDAYFDLFDENGLDPDPAMATSDGQWIIWEFQAPEQGDTLTIVFDARIEPGQQLRRVAATTAILDRGAPTVSVDYATFVMP